jgi:FG-GAP repeat.
MSMKKRNLKESRSAAPEFANQKTGIDGGPIISEPSSRFSMLRRNWLATSLICLLALGTFGAGLKYLEEDARRQIAERKNSSPLNRNKKESWLNSINPFLPAPSPTPTPQLSKEYIYAGSRLLAVEDAGASAAAPADLAVWRPSDGTWYVMGPGGTMQASQQWGTSGDIPAPGDYDGDGKTDFCVFRPSNNNWYIIRSSDSVSYNVSFAAAGDKPVPADYDGDGRTDIAVYRPSEGKWYISRSSDSGVTVQQFGLSTDEPAAADYDGDGRADIAVWRADTQATFYILRSTDAMLQTIQLGQTGDEPLSADYDGDGKADAAVRRGGDWHILQSSNNQTVSYSWGISTDTAVPNDYDGDGKVDVAVWRETNGNWYIRQSSRIGQPDELRQVQWGMTGDIPVPVFYRR